MGKLGNKIVGILDKCNDLRYFDTFGVCITPLSVPLWREGYG